ncbi:MAG: epoxyqueuosine reductase QueH [Syntrophales bacterium]|nr:epoxyqueuosine reductase QueH [Syntrophales bacterium]
MKILLHICCAPCAIYPVRILREEGHEVIGLFYNPNIHPYSEYAKRRDTLEAWCQMENLPLIIDHTYPMESFLKQVVNNLGERCTACYSIRLNHTAMLAKKMGFDVFTSTLLYSKYQKHDIIIETAEMAAQRWGPRLLYRDFRAGWKEGVVKSRTLGLYRQKYCGCLFSEKERFEKGVAKLQQPGK